jgi:UDP-3-O-[3-hydroxymyristoyl] glucosamine N-acyltransferase
MSEPVFFKRAHGLTLAEIVDLTGARPLRPGQGDLEISDVVALDRAGPGDISYADNTDANALRLTRASACFVRTKAAAAADNHPALLAVDDPYRAFVRVAAALYPGASRPSSLFETQGTAVSALVHATARVETGVTIDPAAVIGPHAEIGSGTLIGPIAVIGPEVRIGRNCVIGAGASLTHALLGDAVVIHPGCRLGQSDGNARANQGPQLGRVILQDRVEIGANCAISRGVYGDTIIGEGTIIDPLVQIPAEAKIGRYCKVLANRELPRARESAESAKPFADGVRLFASEFGASIGQM